MNEDQKKWLLYLQEKGIKFEWLTGYDRPKWKAFNARFDFNIVDGLFAFQFRIHAQSIPDIPDWRELCREMRRNGINVEYENSAGSWIGGHLLTVYGEPSFLPRGSYRIPQQPIPEWSNEEMTEETKQETTEEIPHLEQQIQWHEDWLHALRTGEEMREWECRLANTDNDWITLLPYEIPDRDNCEYRRKPRTVTYWHCMCKSEYGVIITGSYESKDYLIQCLKDDKHVILSPITETTVELED